MISFLIWPALISEVGASQTNPIPRTASKRLRKALKLFRGPEALEFILKQLFYIPFYTFLET